MKKKKKARDSPAVKRPSYFPPPFHPRRRPLPKKMKMKSSSVYPIWNNRCETCVFLGNSSVQNVIKMTSFSLSLGNAKILLLVQNTKHMCLSLSFSLSIHLLFSRSCYSFSRICFFCFLDKPIVFFVRWFWAPFFEQVVFAVGVFVVTGASDVLPVVKRRFRPFD